jgi:hypothetical protein
LIPFRGASHLNKNKSILLVHLVILPALQYLLRYRHFQLGLPRSIANDERPYKETQPDEEKDFPKARTHWLLNYGVAVFDFGDAVEFLLLELAFFLWRRRKILEVLGLDVEI